MKKILHILCLCFLGFIAQAQDQSQNQIFIGNNAVDYKSDSENLYMQMQVGSPIISNLHTTGIETRAGFPYGVLYISPTFVVNGFEISKGYFSDRINIKWEFGANQHLIQKVNIYRKEFGSAIPYSFIGSVSNDVFEYDDTQIEGGTLYEYKVEAFGVSAFDERFINFIDGVGFRNPTATVSGSIGFEGGSPVQDVIVFSEANGEENNDSGSSLKIDDGYVSVDNIEFDINANNTTLQSWITNYGEIFKFTTNNDEVVQIFAGKLDNNTIAFKLLLNGVMLNEITLENAYPTGKLDFLGNDIFKNINTLLDTNYIHVSAVLEDNSSAKFYINGREITAMYVESIADSDAFITPVYNSLTALNYKILDNSLFKKIILADDYVGYIDEVRIWQKTLSNEEIRRDYRRYLSGGESNLSLYLRMNETTGTNVYDLSKKGFRQNKNDGIFVQNSDNGVSFNSIKPTSEQLGVLGVTDANGSYTIASIPYSGTGESFVITPSFGVHSFEPASQTVFLGAEASVVNQLNFKDISSFKFNGRAVYNVQNVFADIPTDVEVVDYNTKSIEDYGYNQYRIDGSITVNKGEFYYEGGAINPLNGFYEGGELKRYPVIGLEKAFVYIDGDIVINEDNQPVETDSDGNFSINVPIGKHKIEVKKDGHTFVHSGYFPATGTFEFFEDQIEPTWFIDATRISLVGRVVGGRIESEKPIGFGLEGLFSYLNNEGEENEKLEIISSKNNIGTAQITFKGDLETNVLDVIVETNSASGEYEASLIPYIYHIKQADLKIASNPDLNNAILTSAETLNLLAAPVLDSVKYVTEDGTEFFSKGFHHTKSFRYNSPVSLTLIEQEFEKQIVIGENTFDISGLETPLYLQKKKYNMLFEVSQNYINKEGVEDAVTKEFYTEGTFNINNNLEISGSSVIELVNNNSQFKYTFTAGEPNIAIADNFKSSIAVQYSIPGSNPLSISNSNNFKSEGIIKGGASTGGVAFATYAPEIPDIILRDPPGSNSFASIEKGTSISFTTENINTDSDGNGGGVYVSIGPTFETTAGTPFFSVGNEVNVVADAEENFSYTEEQTNTNTVSKTYEFNTTISTSDEVDFVGSDGDLYIGNSKNVYYGIFNNMFVTDAPLVNNNGDTVANIAVTAKDDNGDDVTLYISTNKDYFIGEQPTKTFFTYSQKYIVETLIPELEALAANFVPDPTLDPNAPLITAASYSNQADLWRKVIQENEKTKYDAKNNREAYRESILATVGQFGVVELPFGGTISNNIYQAEIDELVNSNFFSNQSFDAGVGEFTTSVTTSTIKSFTAETTIDISSEFTAQLGLLVNNLGVVANYTKTNSWVDVDANTSESDVTSTISYTLKDNDQYNVLSVDVVNMFDGNGPVFITKGGATSCPYEAESTSIFYKNIGYDVNVIGEGGETLSDPTNRVYLPEVKSDKTILTNIPESDGALFTLLLKNNSDTQSDLEFIIEVDALTLNGATTNIEPNGVNVFIPFNETIEFPFEVYKSSASSIFEYENIRVYLKAPCDDINDSEGFIDVSVEFKKSCSKVVVSAPQDNFIFNRAEGYSRDIDGNITTNTLPVTFTDFNTDFAGFRKIELQYRNASSANWIKLNTYYGTQQLKDEASDENAIVINSSDSEFTFNWDIVGDKIPDGAYEFRAISYCTDQVTNISPIISGIINLNAPVVFGTPKPSDGILDVGEDISVRFNETISERIGTSISVTGLSNQQDIDHSVSVFLDGGGNQIELPNQILPDSSFTLQFWYKNATTGAGSLIAQQNGINVTLNENLLTFAVGEDAVQAVINPTQYNFYSLVYQSGKDAQLLILENGAELASEVLANNLDLNSNSSMFIGGANVIGNIHDIRFWSKSFTRAQATVAKDKTLSGKELNLLGYWALDEGNGRVGVDKAKSRNATVNLNWDIKPKGTAYSFENNAFLALENVGFVQPSVAEDITFSFWIKTTSTIESTIISNGRGNDEEPMQANGFRNKWSVNMKADGNLELLSENIAYNLTNQSIADGIWHHVALVVKRGGSINSYIDALEVTSVSSENIGGISGNKILIGARLFEDDLRNETIDNQYTGDLDEVRLWNTARSFDQIKRDRYFEVDPKTPGLLLYADFNQEESNTTKGPKYNHFAINNTISSTFSILNGTALQNYTVDSPALKPKLQFTNIPFSTVINGDEMIIQPDLTTEEWSLFEGQILNFSVARLFDTHFNQQLSPVSWSAFVNRQEIEWYTTKQTKEIVAEKNVNETYSFTMDVVNKGGSNQPYTISGLPTWVSVENTSGNVAPNSIVQLVFTVDNELSMGTYNANIFLETASEFNDRLTLDLRVLTQAPNWSVKAPDFSNSMNIIGKIKINETFSRDQYTKVGAFVDNNPRGEAYLNYDAAYDSYFVFLTAYSNVSSGEKVTFKIWDAINGKVLIASMDGAPESTFLQNEVIGSKTNPAIFSGAQFAEQKIALNTGWTWVSFFVEDSRFNNIKDVFDGLQLEDDDLIKNGSDFARFETDNWFGSLLSIENSKMYKIKLANENSLKLIGNDVNESNLNLTINQGWNWLSFPIHRNISLAEALTFYNPTDGDVIKDQYNFAIYDSNSGWSGTLNYMQSQRGYMLKSGAAQIINYPNSNNRSKSVSNGQEHSEETIRQFSKYSANMSIVAEIFASQDVTEVVVYDSDGNLRGVSPIISFEDKKMSFISVFSNTNDVLSFKLSNGITETDIATNFIFENNKVYGNIKTPIVLSAKSLTTNNLFLKDVIIYPNPFSNTITIDVSHQTEKIEKIQMYSTIGVLVQEITVNSDTVNMDTSNLASGIYLIKVTAISGKNSLQKIVKK